MNDVYFYYFLYRQHHVKDDDHLYHQRPRGPSCHSPTCKHRSYITYILCKSKADFIRGEKGFLHQQCLIKHLLCRRLYAPFAKIQPFLTINGPSNDTRITVRNNNIITFIVIPSISSSDTNISYSFKSQRHSYFHSSKIIRVSDNLSFILEIMYIAILNNFHL